MHLNRNWLGCVLVMLSALILATCHSSSSVGSNSGGGSTAPTFTVAPTITLSTKAPLAGMLTLTTDQATTISTSVTDGTDTTTHDYTGSSTTHSVQVLGLHPSTQYTVTVTATNANGDTSTSSTTVTTAALPTPFPALSQADPNDPAAEPGVTLFDVRTFNVPNQGASNPTAAYVVIVDGAGKVVWYAPLAVGADEVHRMSNGDLMIMQPNTKLIEMDMQGNVVHTWISSMDPDYANPTAGEIKVDTDTFHHDVVNLPNGDILALSTSLRIVPGTNGGGTTGFPTSETDMKPRVNDTAVVEDSVVEFNSATGAIVHRWSITADTTDAIDSSRTYTPISPPLTPYRVGYDSFGGFWNPVYCHQLAGLTCDNSATIDGPFDWAHANAIFYDAVNDRVGISLRHQDAVVEWDRGTAQVNWILADHSRGWDGAGNWTMNGDGSWGTDNPYLGKLVDFPSSPDWQYHEHAPTIMSNGDVLMFDNHDYAALTPNAKTLPANNFSRAVEYYVYLCPGDCSGYNTTPARDVTKVWEYKRSDLYSPFIGDADEMPRTGNILVDFGGITKTFSTGGATDNILNGKHWSEIIEVTHTVTPTVVFDLTIGNTDVTDPNGWFAYRAERLPSLYP